MHSTKMWEYVLEYVTANESSYSNFEERYRVVLECNHLVEDMDDGQKQKAIQLLNDNGVDQMMERKPVNRVMDKNPPIVQLRGGTMQRKKTGRRLTRKKDPFF